MSRSISIASIWGHARPSLASGLVTVALTLAFALFLKEDVRSTLAFFDLPGVFSSSTWQAIIAAVAVAVFFVYAKKVGLDLLGGLVLGFCSAICVSTLYNQGDLSVWAIRILPCVATALIVIALSDRYLKNLLKAMLFASVFYLLCNLVFILQRPELFDIDTAEVLFYSYRNSTFKIAIPACACSLLLDVMSKNKISIRSVTIFIVCMAELLIGYSAASFVSLLVLGSLVLWAQFGRLRPWVNGLGLIVLYVIFFFAIVVMHLQDYFSIIIEDVLARNVTFTGRTMIWDMSFAILRDCGYALGMGVSYWGNTIFVDGFFAQHAHNGVLDVLLLGGVCALTCIGAAVAVVSLRLFKNRKERGTAYLVAILSAIALISLVEVVLCPMSFFLLAVAYCWQPLLASGPLSPVNNEP